MRQLIPVIALYGCAASAGAVALACASAPAATFAGGSARDATSPGDTVYRAAFVARTHGSPDATVTVYELSDFQCPYCRQFAMETMPTLDSLYVATGKVRWVFVNYPKAAIHKNAMRAAEFGVCAAAQGRFRAFHDVAFATQREWAGLADPDSAFHAMAAGAAIERTRLTHCLASGTARREVDADLRNDAAWRVGGVPAFMVDGKMIVQGGRALTFFTTALDSVLRARSVR